MKLKVAFAVLALVGALMPMWASAHNVSLFPTGFWGPLVSCVGSQEEADEANRATPAPPAPITVCTSLCDVFHTFQHFIYFGMTLALFVMTPIAILIGGIMMLVAGANPSLYETGKKTVTGTIYGVVIILLAFVIVNTLLGFLNPQYLGSDGSWWVVNCSI